MKIAKVIHHGQTRYRVNDPNGPDGKRQRKSFDTREAAEAYVKDRSADKQEFGLRFVTQPPAERAVRYVTRLLPGARPSVCGAYLHGDWQYVTRGHSDHRPQSVTSRTEHPGPENPWATVIHDTFAL